MTEATRPPTVRHVLVAEARRLQACSPSPRLDVEILLAHVLGTTRERLYAIPERQLTADERARLRALVGRRAQSEPVAYLTGRKAFRDIELQLNEATLIPRPETETLVEIALEKLMEVEGHTLSVLDIGTGSGAVALAIAHEHPSVHVVGTDVQYRALEKWNGTLPQMMGTGAVPFVNLSSPGK